MAKKQHYVAAAPGAELIVIEAFWNDDRDEDDPSDPEYKVFVDHYPIVAWRITRDDNEDRVGEPICAIGSLPMTTDTDTGRWDQKFKLTRLSDGRYLAFERAGSDHFDTIEEAQEHALKRARREHEEEEQAQKFAGKVFPSAEEQVVHDPACLYVTTNGAVGCTCGAVATVGEDDGKKDQP
jgi:hypothetical protein